jgi:hypothetical protein
MVAYGFSDYYNDDPTQTIDNVFTVAALGMFVLMGFGLVLSYYKFGNWLGMTTAIIVVVLNIQLSPLLQKFWFNVFIYHFGYKNFPHEVGNNVQNFWFRYATNQVLVSS